MRDHFMPIRMAIIKKKKKKHTETNKCGQDVGNLEPLCIAGKNIKSCSHCGKQYNCFSEN